RGVDGNHPGPRLADGQRGHDGRGLPDRLGHLPRGLREARLLVPHPRGLGRRGPLPRVHVHAPRRDLGHGDDAEACRGPPAETVGLAALRHPERPRPERHRRGPGAKDLSAAAAYVLLTVVVLWPLSASPARLVVPNDDTYGNAWAMAWVDHQLAADPRHLFAAN